ncbi:N-acetyltransferase [Oceanobacillus piezotolerans]|uniref:N-acetyltransferase n=1 Tax=Oceanobacillus piezotolerans TaxID=2448030 RepID=A0A498DEV5_9BACI|nr:GNAT family N-acetyltransferase [Oceanobacillus piezotolerans]RLL45534.1 N-acetyltransferase [Oceanobacillus piezotolerans]
MKILETERLYLRELALSDAKELSKVLSDPESMQYYPEPFDSERVERWIHLNMDHYKRYHHGLWAVILKDRDIFIGDCGITMQVVDRETVPEIGFHIIKSYWNRGYATEAALACKDYAFHVLQFPKVFSYTNINNVPSQKVAKKIGMQEYKIFEKNGERQIAYVAVNSQKSSKKLESTS